MGATHGTILVVVVILQMPSIPGICTAGMSDLAAPPLCACLQAGGFCIVSGGHVFRDGEHVVALRRSAADGRKPDLRLADALGGGSGNSGIRGTKRHMLLLVIDQSSGGVSISLYSCRWQRLVFKLPRHALSAQGRVLGCALLLWADAAPAVAAGEAGANNAQPPAWEVPAAASALTSTGHVPAKAWHQCHLGEALFSIA